MTQAASEARKLLCCIVPPNYGSALRRDLFRPVLKVAEVA
jgi:hypothetical protein